MTLKSYTKYRCLNKKCAHSGPYTGANTSLPDECRGCGTALIEEEDPDGRIWRLTWEMVSAVAYPHLYTADDRARQDIYPDNNYWHSANAEHKSEYTARDQWDGLHKLQSEGEFIRNIKVEVTTVTWQEVDW